MQRQRARRVHWDWGLVGGGGRLDSRSVDGSVGALFAVVGDGMEGEHAPSALPHPAAEAPSRAVGPDMSVDRDVAVKISGCSLRDIRCGCTLLGPARALSTHVNGCVARIGGSRSAPATSTHATSRSARSMAARRFSMHTEGCLDPAVIGESDEL